MQNVGYYNGEIGALETLKGPALDRAFYFGDGCYEASTFTNNVIVALEEHLTRFYQSCQLLQIPFDMPADDLAIELQRCIDANELDSGIVYWQCSRGTYFRMHAFPPSDVKPNLFIYTSPYEMTPPASSFNLISMVDDRYLLCNIKTLNLIPNVLAAERCREAGCDEVVFHKDGRVTEGAHSNILMLKDRVLHAPPQDRYILPGITLNHLLMLARDIGLEVREDPFTLDDLMDADEVIVSSSGAFCIPASSIDGVPVGGRDKQTLDQLQNAYEVYYAKATTPVGPAGPAGATQAPGSTQETNCVGRARGAEANSYTPL